MTKTLIFRSPPDSQQGFTLVELMISVVISLVLLLFVSTLFISSKGSYRLNDDNARMQEDGRYAMGLIGRNLMQAGFGEPDSNITTSLVNEKGISIQGLMGCDKGFADPAAATTDLACAAAGKPSFHVSYWVDAYDANSGVGTDCNGQNVVTPSATPPKAFIAHIASNRFFLATKDGTQSLYCNGSGNNIPQPVLSNVEDMVVTYGVSTGTSPVPGEYKNGAAVDVFFGEKSNWKKVISVQVCLLISSANNVTPQLQTYTDCNGDSQTATDRKLRTAMTSVFTLRNNAASSLVRGI